MKYFMATLTDFDEKLTLFPYDRYDLNDELILFRDPENAYQIIACLVKNQKKGIRITNKSKTSSRHSRQYTHC